MQLDVRLIALLMQEVWLKIVTCDEDCSIRLFDHQSGGKAVVLFLQLSHLLLTFC